MSTDKNVFTTKLERIKDYQFKVAFDSPTIPDMVTDEPQPVGKGAGPNPARLLSAAVANCLSSSLLFCLSKARVTVRDLEASVETVLQRNDKGRWRIAGLKVKLCPLVDTPDAPGAGRCLELFQDFCIVTESVRKGIQVDVDVEFNSPEMSIQKAHFK